MSRAGQRFVTGVDPGLSGLDSAGDQEDGVFSRIVLPGKRHVTTTPFIVILDFILVFIFQPGWFTSPGEGCGPTGSLARHKGGGRNIDLER